MPKGEVNHQEKTSKIDYTSWCKTVVKFIFLRTFFHTIETLKNLTLPRYSFEKLTSPVLHMKLADRKNKE